MLVPHNQAERLTSCGYGSREIENGPVNPLQLLENYYKNNILKITATIQSEKAIIAFVPQNFQKRNCS